MKQKVLYRIKKKYKLHPMVGKGKAKEEKNEESSRTKDED